MKDSRKAKPTARPALRRLLVGVTLAAALAGVGAAVLLPDAAALAAPDAARPGLVTLNDGKTLEGDVTETAQDVTVNVKGIVTTVPRANVKTIQYGTPEQRLRKQLDALPQSDVSGRLALARDALQKGLLDFAQDTAEGVLRTNPGNAAANAVLDDVSRQRRLNQSSGTGVRPGNPAPGAAPDVKEPARPLPATDVKTLDAEQINLIRQAELQPGDANARQRPRVQFRDDVIKRFGESQKNFDYARFNAQPEVSKALAILSGGDASMRADVRITSDPPAVLEYLRTVQPFVLNGCATSGCHGGTNAGNFVLYATPRDEAASYTNFYILNTYTVKVPDPAGDAFGGGQLTRRMIDRNDPDASLLLNYLLPLNLAKYAHPKVGNYNGLVDNPNNATFQTIRNWIADGLSKQGGDKSYGFDFKLPSANGGENGDDAAGPSTTTAPAEGQ